MSSYNRFCAEHKQGLIEAIADGKLWELLLVIVVHKNAIDKFIDNAIVHLNNGLDLVFATLNRAFSKVVGAARFMAATSAHQR